MDNSFLKPYICTQCGGHVNRATLTCEMCGTQFKDDSSDGVVRLRVERPGVVTLGESIVVGKEVMMFDPEGYSQEIVRQLARKVADAIVPYMDVEMEDDPIHSAFTFRARTRVLTPEYRFRG